MPKKQYCAVVLLKYLAWTTRVQTYSPCCQPTFLLKIPTLGHCPPTQIHASPTHSVQLHFDGILLLFESPGKCVEGLYTCSPTPFNKFITRFGFLCLFFLSSFKSSELTLRKLNQDVNKRLFCLE